jgi:hypothetical protein
VTTPERRTVVKMLIRLDNIGLLGAISSLVLPFTGTGCDDLLSLPYIRGGATAILLLARSRWFNRLATPVIEWTFGRTTGLDVTDYA